MVCLPLRPTWPVLKACCRAVRNLSSTCNLSLQKGHVMLVAMSLKSRPWQVVRLADHASPEIDGPDW